MNDFAEWLDRMSGPDATHLSVLGTFNAALPRELRIPEREEYAAAILLAVETALTIRRVTGSGVVVSPADARDAARYAWLRENCVETADTYGISGQLYFGTFAMPLDAALDAAMISG